MAGGTTSARSRTAVVTRLLHYFETYKLAPGAVEKPIEITHVFGREEAHEIIRRSQEDYHELFGYLELALSAALEDRAELQGLTRMCGELTLKGGASDGVPGAAGVDAPARLRVFSTLRRWSSAAGTRNERRWPLQREGPEGAFPPGLGDDVIAGSRPGG